MEVEDEIYGGVARNSNSNLSALYKVQPT